MRQFFTTMTNWHRYVALAGDARPTGKAITGAANLMFLFIVLSGMYLWWPKSLTWGQVRNVTWFRGGLRAKARDFNWHNTIGFWSALPLAIVVYSATVISYPWSNNLVYRVMGEEPPAPAAGRAGGPGAGSRPRGRRCRRGVADRAATARGHRSHGRTRDDVSRRLGDGDAARAGVFGRTRRIHNRCGDAGQPNLRGTLTFAGSSEKWEDFSAQTPGRRVRTWLRFAHTGEIYGLAGQTIAGLVSAGGAVLVYTGLALRRLCRPRSGPGSDDVRIAARPLRLRRRGASTRPAAPCSCRPAQATAEDPRGAAGSRVPLRRTAGVPVAGRS